MNGDKASSNHDIFSELDIDVDVSEGHSSTSSLLSMESDSSRDEVEELKKFNRKDNWCVSIFRLLTALLLFATAVLVTFNSYVSLENEQTNNFEAAVSD